MGFERKLHYMYVFALAARISTQETSQLGSQANYMKKLLELVKKRIDTKQVDITLKFTLSALWNLTDESPTTCSVFLNEGGMTLFLQVLQVFPEDVSIETKVLGLLNNIAEVSGLRENLMVDAFISILA
jgi:Zyg-11 family protein